MPEYEVFVNGKPRKIELTKSGETCFCTKIDGRSRNLELANITLDVQKPFTVKIDNKTYKVELLRIERGKESSIKVEEVTFKAEVKIPARKSTLSTFEPTVVTPTRRAPTSKQTMEGAITASMTGKVISVRVKKGDTVKAGQVLCVIEAMKMENEITAPKTGEVKEVYVSDGSSVSEGEPLVMVA